MVRILPFPVARTSIPERSKARRIRGLAEPLPLRRAFGNWSGLQRVTFFLLLLIFLVFKALWLSISSSFECPLVMIDAAFTGSLPSAQKHA